MNQLVYISLIVIALMAIAAGPATTGAPARRPELSGTLNPRCTPQLLWCEGMKSQFQKVYPTVAVDSVRLSSGEALTRLRNEGAPCSHRSSAATTSSNGWRKIRRS